MTENKGLKKENRKEKERELYWESKIDYEWGEELKKEWKKIKAKIKKW